MLIKGMQKEETVSSTKGNQDESFNGKQSPPKREETNITVTQTEVNETSSSNVNGLHKKDEVENISSSTNGTKVRSSPSATIEDVSQTSSNVQFNQPLNFELGPEVGNNFSTSSYWGMTQSEESSPLQNFQSFNSGLPSYSLNNNNSFPPLPFGSIGQPSYMPSTSQFSSLGMPNMSLINNMGPVNNPVGSFNFQTSQNQNQRRAITAQHNYGAMSNKPLNPRLPWGNQSSWSNNTQQNNVSPWTMALQQQKAISRSNNAAASNMKKGQSALNVNQTAAINHLIAQQKLKRSSPVPNQMLNNAMARSPYTGPIGDRSGESFTNGPEDSMKMDSIQTQLMDIMRQSSQFDLDQQKNFSGSLDVQYPGEDGPPPLDHTQNMPMLNGSYGNPFSAYRPDRPERFSRKVFVGGLPPDIDEDEITASFSRFGPVVVDWPHKAESKSYFPPKGYCFLLFQEEISVQALIDACIPDDNKLYWCVTSPTMKDKPVQIRPWNLSDSDFVMDGSQPLDPRKTIFVGGVPRPLRAVELASIIDRLYGGVCYAGIDTDPELKYPKGAGRVAFSNQQSYISAISARFVQLQHGDIDKRVEVKPYVLDDQFCDECQGARCNQKFAPFFCANITCLQYYCEQCWATIHSRPGREYHKPLVKEGADRPRAVPFRWC